MKAVFADSSDSLGDVMAAVPPSGDLELVINRDPDIVPDMLPGIIGDAETVIIDHTALPTELAKQCAGLKHVIFLGTGARSYMEIEELQSAGITVHTIKSYGDTSIAECAIGLMFAVARGFCRMDRAMREGRWTRIEGIELKGKTLGLIGFGSIAAETARIATGAGMKTTAWNRSPKSHEGVEFLDLETVLETSDVLSIHLLFNDETRGFLSKSRIAAMKQGAILINTARGAIVDETAMIEALRSGHLFGAGLDVYAVEPVTADHPLLELDNVTLSAHSAFRTPEASQNLIEAAIDHCRRIAATGK